MENYKNNQPINIFNNINYKQHNGYIGNRDINKDLIYNYYFGSNISYNSNNYYSTNYEYNNTQQNIKLYENINNENPCRFFIIKSNNEDNIHKSIKYRIWSSTVKGNKILETAYEKSSHIKPIILFFSVNGSGRFVGVAQMISNIQYNNNFNLWFKNEEWNGFFFVKWIYIKDIPNKILSYIINTLNENKSVTHSRNSQEVNYESGLKMLNIFQNYENKTSIMDDFSYYEYQQNLMMNNKNNINN